MPAARCVPIGDACSITCNAARPPQLAQRQALLTRQIQENGVTYNVYADPKGADRPWELDLVPHVLAAEEWQQLSAGIAQRARLLNAVLADLYGPQRLIKEGLLPAELVFGHNNFSVAVPGYPAARRCVPASVRGRPGAYPGWPLVGHRRPHPSPVGRRLRPGKPHHRVPRLPGPLPGYAGAAPHRVSFARCRKPWRARPLAMTSRH